ncbi:MAG: DUF1800 domain-containing protein [Bacteroidota bacterium]
MRTLTALEPYVPSTDKPWNERRIRHLYDRLGYGARLSDLQEGLQLSPGELVDQLINQVMAAPQPPPPFWANYTSDDYGDDNDMVFEHKAEFVARWAAAMIDDPIRSKMALFWHNHFVTEEEVYGCNSYMWSYFALLYQQAFGNFRTFVEEMGKNPAMLVYLNGNINVADAPNENYARDLMELFTMGQNNGYTQTDVVEVSRALTGWRVEMYECTPPYFDNNLFDGSSKSIFGRSGNWGYDDVHELIFTERSAETATYICSKLYKFLVYDKTDDEVIQAMAQSFQDNNWELAPVLRTLLKSDHFFDERFINSRIKDPFEYFISLLRIAGIESTDLEADWSYELFSFCRECGQELFNPVDVAGWPGHHSWINENTLTVRWGFMSTLLFSRLGNSDDLKGTLRQLAVDLTDRLEKDPAVVTQALIAHFLNTSLDEAHAQAALQYFKGEIPENYFEDGTWTLYFPEVPDQILNLLFYLMRLPEGQLA